MISKIQGKVRSKKQGKVLLEVAGGISYEVLVPDAVMRSIEKDSPDGSDISLTTYYYFQSDPSKSIPVLIGFLNEIEKEFFEKFITVSGVGPKAACRALSLPISEIADAIDRADLVLLKTLPGIGEQRAKEIIAKLQGKVGKFGLIQDRLAGRTPRVAEDVKEEALSVLLQLQYRKKEATEMIEKALKRNPALESSEDLLNEVYKSRQKEKK
ncbi:MAG: Holliday junction branch migration protein RuvA [Candidatus Omnitrophota bacterium]